MKTLLIIYTPYGDRYEVNELGEIKSKNLSDFSKSWKLQGIENVKSNEYIPFKELTKERVKELQLFYKNGNPRYTVRDLDHGTTRTWGNTKVHGISGIHFPSL
jgi:hypothetical protein